MKIKKNGYTADSRIANVDMVALKLFVLALVLGAFTLGLLIATFY